MALTKPGSAALLIPGGGTTLYGQIETHGGNDSPATVGAGNTPINCPNQVPQQTPKPVTGLWKTPVIDIQQSSFVGIQADIQLITTKSFTATGGKLQLEFSNDANAFTVATATNAGTGSAQVTVSAQGPQLIGGQTKPPYRFVQGRLVAPPSIAAVGSALASNPSSPKQNGTAIAMTPDGKYLLYGSSTTPFLEAFPITASSGAFGTVVDSSALAGTVVAIDVIGSNGNYWVAVAMSTTPYAAVIPFTGAAFGTAVTPTALAGAGLSVKWIPGIADPTKQQVVWGLTGAPGVTGYQFDTTSSTGAFGTALTLTKTATAQSLSVPGANVVGIMAAADGSFLTTLCSSTPFLYTFTLADQSQTATTTPITGQLPNPNGLPAGAGGFGDVHPSGECISFPNSTNIYTYAIYRNGAAYGASKAGSANWVTALNPQGWAYGPLLTKAATGTAVQLAYHPNGAYLAAVTGTTPFEVTWPTADLIAGLGTAETGQAALTNMTAGKGGVWHPNGQFIYICGTSSAAAGSLGGYPFAGDLEVGMEIFASSMDSVATS